MTKSRRPQPLSNILAADAQLATWQARRIREEALTAVVRRHLPRQLGERVRAVAAGSGSIELRTTAGAVAAALRQRLPDVIAAMQREGVDCSGIRIRVQVRQTAEPPRKPVKNPL